MNKQTNEQDDEQDDEQVKKQTIKTISFVHLIQSLGLLCLIIPRFDLSIVIDWSHLELIARLSSRDHP